MTVGALLWGLVAEVVGLQVTFLAAAVGDAGWRRRRSLLAPPETGHLDRELAVYWPEARLAFEPELDSGPVLVTVEHTVASEREAAFLEAMGNFVGLDSRLGRRAGSSTGTVTDRTALSNSSASHPGRNTLRQHAGRLTATDQDVEEAALAFSDPPARADHLLPP